MAWIQSHDTLENSIKLQKFCEYTGLNKFEAIGLLHSVWHWIARQQEDGDISNITSDALIWGIGYPKVNLFGDLKESLLKAGFLDEDGFLHNWMVYVNKYLYSKYHTANPKRYDAIIKKWDNRNIGKPKICPKDNPKESPKYSPDKIREDNIRLDDIREDKRREEEKTQERDRDCKGKEETATDCFPQTTAENVCLPETQKPKRQRMTLEEQRAYAERMAEELRQEQLAKASRNKILEEVTADNS